MQIDGEVLFGLLKQVCPLTHKHLVSTIAFLCELDISFIQTLEKCESNCDTIFKDTF